MVIIGCVKNNKSNSGLKLTDYKHGLLTSMEEQLNNIEKAWRDDNDNRTMNIIERDVVADDKAFTTYELFQSGSEIKSYSTCEYPL